MNSEYTRQTRWGHAPEPLEDEDAVPPGGIYVKQVVWLPCTACDLQVHGALTQYITGGLACPECGARLSYPGVLGNPDVEAAKIAQVEDYLRDQVEQGPVFAEE